MIASFQPVQKSQQLNGNQRRHGHHGHNAECIGENIAADCIAGRPWRKEAKRWRSSAGSHAAGIKSDSGENLGGNERQTQRKTIARD